MRGIPTDQPLSEEHNPFFDLLSETFKTLGDATRIKIVWLLARQEMNVGQLCQAMNMSQPAISHHLRVLRQMRLVSVRKDGTSAHYTLDDEHINHLLKEGTEHVQELLQ